MGEQTFDWRAHLESIYGFKAQPFQIAPATLQPQYSKKGSTIYQDILGVRYYLPVILGGITYPHAVVSVQGKKTIVETPMVNRRGTVKEMISIDDYKIGLDMFLINDDRTFPEDQIDEVVEMWKLNEVLKMQCALTDYFLSEDDSVVIKAIDFPAQRGVVNVRRVRLELESDSIFELEITAA